MAEKYQFIMIAPDSRSASLSGWRVQLAKDAPTPDVLHAQVSSAPEVDVFSLGNGGKSGGIV